MNKYIIRMCLIALVITKLYASNDPIAARLVLNSHQNGSSCGGFRFGSTDSKLVIAVLVGQKAKARFCLGVGLDMPEEFPIFDEGYPIIIGDGVTQEKPGDLCALWEHTAKGTHTVTAIICPGRKVTADVEVYFAPKTIINIPSSTLDSYKKKINTVLNAISEVKDAVAISGSISGSHQKVDYFNDGTKLGNKVELDGKITFGTKALNPKTRPIPIPAAPFLTVQFGLKINPISIGVAAKGSIDDCKSEKGQISGTLSGSSIIAITAEGVAGVNTGDDVYGGSVTGTASTSVKAIGSVTADSIGLYSEGEVSYSGVVAEVEAQFKIGDLGEFQLAKGSVTVLDGDSEKLPKVTLYTW